MVKKSLWRPRPDRRVPRKVPPSVDKTKGFEQLFDGRTAQASSSSEPQGEAPEVFSGGEVESSSEHGDLADRLQNHFREDVDAPTTTAPTPTADDDDSLVAELEGCLAQDDPYLFLDEPFDPEFKEEPIGSFQDAFVGQPIAICNAYLDMGRGFVSAVDNDDPESLAQNLGLQWGQINLETLGEHEKAH